MDIYLYFCFEREINEKSVKREHYFDPKGLKFNVNELGRQHCLSTRPNSLRTLST